MPWIVIRGRQFPDQSDVTLWGPFDSQRDAEAFIEDAHDPSEHGEGVCNEPHMLHDDVEYSEVMYMNGVSS